MMFEPHEMYPDTLTDRELATLPPDAQALAGQLAADGAAWRAALPTTATVDTYILTLARADVAPRDRQDDALVLEGPPPSLPLEPLSGRGRASGRGLRRLGRVAGIAAMAAVVILFAAVYALRAPGTRPGHRAGEPTATPGVTRDLAWQEQPQLGPAALGGAPDTDPVIAPSDPRVVYESSSRLIDASRGISQLVLRRTDDAGATWHILPLPVPDDSGSIVVGPRDFHTLLVSPLDAHTIFLHLYERYLYERYGDACPSIFRPPAGSGAICQPQYRSTDGGMTWAPLVTPDYHIPGVPVKGFIGLSGLMGTPGVLRAQGARLYSALNTPPDSFGIRIVASDDDGATWRFVDDALVAQGVDVLDYALAPKGVTIFAITFPGFDNSGSTPPRSLWRSDDVGATWRRIGLLPTPDAGVLTTVASADPARPLLYLDAPIPAGDWPGTTSPMPSFRADDLKVSADGGRTWQSAPTNGAQSRLRTIPMILGTLTDGSIVVGFVQDVQDLGAPPTLPTGRVTLYAWRLGDTSWRQLTPELDDKLDTLVISHAGGHEVLWVTTQTDTPNPDHAPDASPTVLSIDYHVLRFQLA